MNRFGIVATLCSFALTASAGETVLTHGWRFSKDGGKNWSEVCVPHDWAIAGPFDLNAKSGATGTVAFAKAEELVSWGVDQITSNILE